MGASLLGRVFFCVVVAVRKINRGLVAVDLSCPGEVNWYALLDCVSGLFIISGFGAEKGSTDCQKMKAVVCRSVAGEHNTQDIYLFLCEDRFK